MTLSQKVLQKTPRKSITMVTLIFYEDCSLNSIIVGEKVQEKVRGKKEKREDANF